MNLEFVKFSKGEREHFKPELQMIDMFLGHDVCVRKYYKKDYNGGVCSYCINNKASCIAYALQHFSLIYDKRSFITSLIHMTKYLGPYSYEDIGSYVTTHHVLPLSVERFMETNSSGKYLLITSKLDIIIYTDDTLYVPCFINNAMSNFILGAVYPKEQDIRIEYFTYPAQELFHKSLI